MSVAIADWSRGETLQMFDAVYHVDNVKIDNTAGKVKLLLLILLIINGLCKNCFEVLFTMSYLTSPRDQRK